MSVRIPVAELTAAQIDAQIAFLDTPKLRMHYSGLLHELHEERARRIAASGVLVQFPDLRGQAFDLDRTHAAIRRHAIDSDYIDAWRMRTREKMVARGECDSIHDMIKRRIEGALFIECDQEPAAIY